MGTVFILALNAITFVNRISTQLSEIDKFSYAELLEGDEIALIKQNFFRS